MLLIPAIDLKNGTAVRLRQGKMDDVTEYGNPVEMAQRWVKAGARRIHLVDLDGAVSGKPENRQIVHDIVEACPGVPIQIGGGIRDEDTVAAYIEAGVQYVIIGTRAVTHPHFVNEMCLEFPNHVIVGLDAKDGKVAISGWSKLSKHDVIDMAQHFEEDGVASIIYTDISKDGMMNGFNAESTVKLAQAVRIPVIASGGVTNLDDVRKLCEVEDEGVEGAIIGRALYEGGIDFAEAQKLADELGDPNVNATP